MVVLKLSRTFAKNGVTIKNTALQGISCKLAEETFLVKINNKLLLQKPSGCCKCKTY